MLALAATPHFLATADRRSPVAASASEWTFAGLHSSACWRSPLRPIFPSIPDRLPRVAASASEWTLAGLHSSACWRSPLRPIFPLIPDRLSRVAASASEWTFAGLLALAATPHFSADPRSPFVRSRERQRVVFRRSSTDPETLVFSGLAMANADPAGVFSVPHQAGGSVRPTRSAGGVLLRRPRQVQIASGFLPAAAAWIRRSQPRPQVPPRQRPRKILIARTHH